jgi:hypothetical protein
MRKRIRRRIRHQGEGVNVAADIDGVIAVNSGSSSQRQSVSVKSASTVVQRGDRKAGDEQREGKQSNQEEGR